MGFYLIYWTPQFILFVWFYFGKMLNVLEKRPFCFRTDMAGLGKYHMGGYGLIGVYRDKVTDVQVAVINTPINDWEYDINIKQQPREI